MRNRSTSIQTRPATSLIVLLVGSILAPQSALSQSSPTSGGTSAVANAKAMNCVTQRSPSAHFLANFFAQSTELRAPVASSSSPALTRWRLEDATAIYNASDTTAYGPNPCYREEELIYSYSLDATTGKPLPNAILMAEVSNFKLPNQTSDTPGTRYEFNAVVTQSNSLDGVTGYNRVHQAKIDGIQYNQFCRQRKNYPNQLICKLLNIETKEVQYKLYTRTQ